MLTEKRTAVRQIVNRPAKFQETEITRMRECMIRDITDQGVRLVVPGGLKADQFTLFDGRQKKCRVIWRLGEVVGARFEK